ncbi:MAG: Flp pilus assembly protein CpaB, partial [Vicinamibacterales bacterium]
VQTVNAPTQPVVVAAADLALGSELKSDDLRVVQFPKGQVPEGTFARPEEILGRGLIVSVVRNEPILGAKLASKEAGAGLPPIIPTGMRAVSVRVNEVIGVAGYVLPGTRVDVLATGSPSRTNAETITKVVLQNIQVLTAGTRIERDDKEGKPVQVTVVTMAVTPEQAERLALASTEGKIQLALRNPLDTSTPETPGMRTALLLGAARAPVRMVKKTQKPGQAPVFVSEPAPTVEVIRGDKRATEIVR